MTAPAWLIAEREIRTYVATASFWVALAIGPIVAGGALLLANAQTPPTVVSVVSEDSSLVEDARAALVETAALEGRHLRFRPDGAAVHIGRDATGVVTLRFADGFPLSPEGRAFVARTMERDLALLAANATPQVADVTKLSGPANSVNPSALSGFVLMMMLWLTLTGSLGMLLQSVVRERANRALESLLAAATPNDIMIGKLVGVGAISFALLIAWFGSVAAYACLFSLGSGLLATVFSTLVAPLTLARATLIYVLGYAFYGSLTISLGAIARDSAAAQNLSRPMFVMLLAAFFVSLFSASARGLPSWLLLLPPFAPFLLLLKASAAVPFATQAASLCLLLLSAICAARFAASRLRIAPQDPGFLASLRKLVSARRLAL